VTLRGWRVVRCGGCRLVFVWPQPTPAELAELYSSGQYHAKVDEAERRRYFTRRLRQIEELAPSRGRILDVGCSKGYFLDVARAAGWDAVGIDLNRNAVEEARARGLDARQGELSVGLFEETSFDVVALFDLLEHTCDPRSTLRLCHHFLRPGGLLVLTTPDIGGLVPRATYCVFAKTIGAWGHPTPPGHLVQFSRKTLRRAIEGSGFQIVRQRSEHIPIGYSAGKLENAIMDVLAGRHLSRPKPQAANGLGSECHGWLANRGHGWASPRLRSGQGQPWHFARERNPSPFRRLPRLLVRGVCWVVVGFAGLAARATRLGDSRWVAARK
jgi:2-polyprenyl-3-methyl-5-hydroxy-6-metoxy-1,4-benzoquinol methylase